jgi:hypothetical protein
LPAESGGPILRLLEQLEDKVDAFQRAVEQQPDNIDRARADHLEFLALYAQRLAAEAVEALRDSADGALGRLGRELQTKALERTQRTWDGRFAWACSDARQMRQHHLARLRQLLHAPGRDHAAKQRQTRALMEASKTLIVAAASDRLLEVDAAVVRLLRDLAARETPPDLGSADRALRSSLVEALAGSFPSGATRGYACRLADGWEKARSILQVEGDTAGLRRRQVLLGEWEDVQQAEDRLRRLAGDWEAARDPVAEDAVADAALAEAFARQEGWLLGERLALLWLHGQLEKQPDAERELALVRVVIEKAARDLQALTDAVEQRLAPAEHRQRPLVEPGFGPPAASAAEYLSGPEPYGEGDFLTTAVDLLRPRLVPEMLTAAPPKVPPAVAEVVVAANRIRTLATRGEALRLQVRTRDERLALAWRLQELEAAAYLADALAWEVLGRAIHPAAHVGMLENESAGLLAAMLLERVEPLVEETPCSGSLWSPFAARTTVAGRLLETVALSCSLHATPPAPRHLSPDILELEARKMDFRHRLATLKPVLSAIPAATPARLVLEAPPAEAAAWLLGADAVLGRLAWLARQRQAEQPDDPVPLPLSGRRAFALCLQEVRARLRYIDEQLLALRRGYWPARARAAIVFSTAVDP